MGKAGELVKPVVLPLSRIGFLSCIGALGGGDIGGMSTLKSWSLMSLDILGYNNSLILWRTGTKGLDKRLLMRRCRKTADAGC